MTEVKAGYSTSNSNGWRCHTCGVIVSWNETHTHSANSYLDRVIAGADDDTQSEGAGAELARLRRDRDEWVQLAMRYLKEIQDLRAILGRVHAATAPREEILLEHTSE